MKPIIPAAIRLLATSQRALDSKPPRPPFGLKSFNPNAAAIAILLDPAGVDLLDPAAVASQLPDPTTLPPSTPVFILGTSAAAPGLFGRWFGAGAFPVPPAVRCTALLARGYAAIGAFVDEERSGTHLVYATSVARVVALS